MIRCYSKPFLTNVPDFFPLKTPENPWSFDIKWEHLPEMSLKSFIFHQHKLSRKVQTFKESNMQKTLSAHEIFHQDAQRKQLFLKFKRVIGSFIESCLPQFG